jgi:hypothetical protein
MPYTPKLRATITLDFDVEAGSDAYPECETLAECAELEQNEYDNGNLHVVEVLDFSRKHKVEFSVVLVPDNEGDEK